MKIIRRFQPDEPRQLMALMLLLKHTPSTAIEHAQPGKGCDEGTAAGDRFEQREARDGR